MVILNNLLVGALKCLYWLCKAWIAYTSIVVGMWLFETPSCSRKCEYTLETFTGSASLLTFTIRKNIYKEISIAFPHDRWNHWCFHNRTTNFVFLLDAKGCQYQNIIWWNCSSFKLFRKSLCQLSREKEISLERKNARTRK